MWHKPSIHFRTFILRKFLINNVLSILINRMPCVSSQNRVLFVTVYTIYVDMLCGFLTSSYRAVAFAKLFDTQTIHTLNQFSGFFSCRCYLRYSITDYLVFLRPNCNQTLSSIFIKANVAQKKSNWDIYFLSGGGYGEQLHQVSYGYGATIIFIFYHYH